MESIRKVGVLLYIMKGVVGVPQPPHLHFLRARDFSNATANTLMPFDQNFAREQVTIISIKKKKKKKKPLSSSI